MTSRAALESALAERLGSVSEARWMAEEVLGRRRAGESPVGADAARALAAMATRRLSGEPLQYVLGTWAFRTLELGVDERALIPRPETEQVVDVALAELRRAGRGSPAPGPIAADLGTGSGAIALALAAETPGVRVWAADVDAGALALAAENRRRLGAASPGAAARVQLCRGRWFGALPGALRGRVDLVVSNPPYVSAGEWPGLDEAVRREPRRALVAADGTDGTPGFAAVEAVLRGAPRWLGERGVVVVEHAEHQAAPARRLARRLGFVDVRTAPDLAGRERAVVCRR